MDDAAERPPASPPIADPEAPSDAATEADRVARAVLSEPHRARRSFHLLFGLSGLLASVPFVTGLGDGAIPLLGAVLFGGLGWWTRRTYDQSRHIGAAQNQLSLGRLDVADALLDGVPASLALGLVRKRAATTRAQVALARGDLAGCRAAADEALAIHTRLSGNAESSIDLRALSLRAFAAAALGDLESAGHDVVLTRKRASEVELGAAVLGGDEVLTEPLARAAMAEAVVLLKRGHTAELRGQLAAHRGLVRTHGSRRDRALFGGLERLARERVVSPYRVTEPAVDGRIEPDPGDWAARVLPEVRPFLPLPPSSTATTETPRLPGGRSAWGGPIAPGSLTDRPRRARRHGAIRPERRLWRSPAGPLIAFFLAAPAFYLLRQALFGADTMHRTGFTGVFLGCIAGVIAILASSSMRVRRERHALERAYRLSAAGREASAQALLREMGSRTYALHGARAELSMAQASARRGDFDEVLEHAERGMLLVGHMAAGALGEWVRPELTAERAAAMAALGRSAEAAHELQTLPISFASKACAVFRTQLLAHLSAGQLEDAAALARARSAQLPIDARTELLADLAMAVSNGGSGMSERQRLREELEDDDQRAFVAKICPALLEDFESSEPVHELDPDRASVEASTVLVRVPAAPLAEASTSHAESASTWSDVSAEQRAEEEADVDAMSIAPVRRLVSR